jgi:hypothetical protein
LQEKGVGGLSTCQVLKYTQLLLLIPDTQIKKYYYQKRINQE